MCQWKRTKDEWISLYHSEIVKENKKDRNTSIQILPVLSPRSKNTLQEKKSLSRLQAGEVSLTEVGKGARLCGCLSTNTIDRFI